MVPPLIVTEALLQRCAAGRGLIDEATTLLDHGGRPLHSRVHALRSLDRIRPGLRVWLKRDDELSFGASGSKARKYSSLIPALQARGVTDVAVVGQWASNNVLAAVQLLREAGFGLHVVLREEDEGGLPLLVHDLLRVLTRPEEVTRVAPACWDETLAEVLSGFAARVRADGGIPEVIPEGGSHPEALVGAITLGIDLVRNESLLGHQFDHVFIEAGSGMSALALALCLALLDRSVTLHVLCTYIQPAELTQLVSRCLRAAGGDERPGVRLVCHPSYSRLPPAEWHEIAQRIGRYMQTDGVLLDPEYSARLVLLAQKVITTSACAPGNALVVHTGGAIGLLKYLEFDRHRADPADRGNGDENEGRSAIQRRPAARGGLGCRTVLGGNARRSAQVLCDPPDRTA